MYVILPQMYVCRRTRPGLSHWIPSEFPSINACISARSSLNTKRSLPPPVPSFPSNRNDECIHPIFPCPSRRKFVSLFYRQKMSPVENERSVGSNAEEIPVRKRAEFGICLAPNLSSPCLASVNVARSERDAGSGKEMFASKCSQPASQPSKPKR